VIAHSARGFTNEAAIPIIGMQSVPDLDFPRHFRVLKKPAVTDNPLFTTRDNGKLRWDAGAIPTHNFLDESDSLFFAFGENA